MKIGVVELIGESFQIASNRGDRTERGETAARIVEMSLDMFGHEGIEQRAIVVAERFLSDEDVGERSVLLSRPNAERGDELIAVDEIVLKREDAEEQIAVGIAPRVRSHGGLAKRIETKISPSEDAER